MDFFEQLKRDDLPVVTHPDLKKATRISDRLLGGYLKLFNTRLGPMKPIARVNGLVAYDLTQPPLDSEAGARVLRTGFNYIVLRKQARPINMVLMMTPICDMKCQHCSARNYMRSERKPLNPAEIKDVVEQFVEMGGASVVFQRELPKYQYQCFLRTLVKGVPLVPAGASSLCE